MREDVVKDRPTRRVVRMVGSDGQTQYRKTSVLKSHFWRRIRARLGIGGISREARQLRRVAARDVVVPRVVSCELEGGLLPTKQHLVTEALEGYAHLETGGEVDPQIAHKLGVALRGWHDKGVLHEDLHRQNLLRRDAGEWALLDGDRIILVDNASATQRRKNILTLMRGLRGLRTESVLSEFLRGYGDHDAVADPDRLTQEARWDLVLHCRERAKRALKQNPDFAHRTAGDLHWHCKAAFHPPDAAELERSQSEDVLKAGNSTTVFRWRDTVVKVFHRRGRIFSRLRAMLRGTRAQRAFVHGHLLELLGISTAPVLAFADASPWRTVQTSYLVTEDAKAADQLTSVFWDLSTSDRLAVARRLGDVLGRMHDAGCLHGDLKGRNILRLSNGELWLLDLDGMTTTTIPAPHDACIKDLQRLARTAQERTPPSPREMLAWARAYERQRRVSRGAPLVRELMRV